MDKKLDGGILVLKRIKLIMEYELSKTYTENLNEQPDSKMPFQIEKFGYNPNNPSTLGPALQKQEDVFRSLSKLDSHDWLALISLTTGIFGMIPTPFSPFLLGISLAADVTDGIKYISEGDKYTGGLLLALAIIPGHQLYKQLKYANTVKKIGKNGVEQLIKKSKSGTLNKKESQILKQALKELTDESEVLVNLTKQSVGQNLIKVLGKKSLKFLINLLFLLKSVVGEVGKFGLQIGGIYYAFDEIYLAIFADDIKELDVRKYGKIQQLIAIIKRDENYFRDLLIHENVKFIDEAIKQGKDLTTLNPTEKMEVSLEKFKKLLKNEKSQSLGQFDKVPSIEEVLSKKINPYTKKLYTFHKGQKGEVIKKIQNLLIKLGYEDVLSGFFQNQTEGADGVFGDNTKEAVIEFQKDNNISIDGVVGSETLELLFQKTK